jgi:glycolate oxidase iron-sulfur subunit
MAWSERLEEILSRCLLCGACAQICANSVPTNRLIQQARQGLFEAGKGGCVSRRLIRSVRQGELAGRVAVKGGALLEGLLCRKIPDSSGLHLRFPLSFFAQRATVPPVAWHPFLEAFRPDAMEKVDGTRVGFFVGCGANYLFPDTAWALVRILKRLGVTVVIPGDQVCCGLPAYVSGDMKTARALARKNIETFRSLKVDAVLTVCASCGSHLQDLGGLFEDDPVWQDAASGLAARHKDAMAFLVEALSLDHYLRDHGSGARFHGGGAYRVAYHDPCHLRIGQGITDGPRRLLKATPGIAFIETPHPGRCCGHGGDFNLSHFDLSMEILDRRMEDFQAVEAHAIVTGCTGCLLQIAEGVSRKGLAGKVQVCHPLVLVVKAMALSAF